MKAKRIMAGEVLTKNLLTRINKAAYQYGGLPVVGEIQTKTAFNLDAKTAVQLSREHIKGCPEKFLSDFQKTMNASYFEIQII
jgi:hypothetical protein